VDRPDKPSELSEAALSLDRELRRFADLADQAALTRAAESQDKINANVQQLVAAVSVTRQKQESDAAALMKRAEEIAGRRKEFAEVLQRMAGLGLMAKEVQEALKAGAAAVDEVQSRMQRIADEAADIGRIAQEKEMEDVARQAEGLRQQILAARNKVALLSPKARA